jgi:ubiquitin-like protein Pup
MAEQEQKKRSDEASVPAEHHGDTASPPQESGEKLIAELDDILDQIDEVLEENAEEFVRNYVQKGGE